MALSDSGGCQPTLSSVAGMDCLRVTWCSGWMACMIVVVREGLQCGLVKTFHALGMATARSPGERTRAWDLLRFSAGSAVAAGSGGV